MSCFVAVLILSYRTGWHRGNALYLYLDGTQFESWPGHWLS
jgi:hypothetical protein